eukprot:186364_1
MAQCRTWNNIYTYLTASTGKIIPRLIKQKIKHVRYTVLLEGISDDDIPAEQIEQCQDFLVSHRLVDNVQVEKTDSKQDTVKTLSKWTSWFRYWIEDDLNDELNELKSNDETSQYSNFNINELISLNDFSSFVKSKMMYIEMLLTVPRCNFRDAYLIASTYPALNELFEKYDVYIDKWNKETQKEEEW